MPKRHIRQARKEARAIREAEEELVAEELELEARRQRLIADKIANLDKSNRGEARETALEREEAALENGGGYSGSGGVHGQMAAKMENGDVEEPLNKDGETDSQKVSVELMRAELRIDGFVW
mmetsp:Transcript_29980/g.47629  ORF Transcript_29980/g.47629 Transcript_29980/m.47629 type:complete len:122 (+) Transcript_29980:122-487(+)